MSWITRSMIMEVKSFYYYRGVSVDRKEWGGSFLVGRECGEGVNFVNGLESMGGKHCSGLESWGTKVGSELESVCAGWQAKKKERKKTGNLASNVFISWFIGKCSSYSFF